MVRRGLPWECKEPLYTLGSGQVFDSSQFVTNLSTKLLPESDAHVLKYVAVLTYLLTYSLLQSPS